MKSKNNKTYQPIVKMSKNLSFKEKIFHFKASNVE